MNLKKTFKLCVVVVLLFMLFLGVLVFCNIPASVGLFYVEIARIVVCIGIALLYLVGYHTEIRRNPDEERGK